MADTRWASALTAVVLGALAVGLIVWLVASAVEAYRHEDWGLLTFMGGITLGAAIYMVMETH